ncbi:MAG: hypothetical protein K6F00_12050 [Lachnospiraceae bacterium]|nr:hypothetical protein [Lachnospiraceae bacterium]
MKVKCEYCGGYIDDTEERCPSCGAVNKNLRRTNNVTPKTIEELKQYFDDNGYTAEKTRFFIGIDYKQPKAFGIYKNEHGNCVVYKNKANGERAIRYEGSDEAYAVNEIWMRFQEEILNQKRNYYNKKSSVNRKPPSKIKRFFRRFQYILMPVGFILIGLLFLKLTDEHTGYYRYNDETYYKLEEDNWYHWDSVNDDWYRTYDIPVDFDEDYKTYYYEGDLDNITDFTDTDYYSDWYEENQSYDSDYSNDSSSDWSSDDWDSDTTDWDSDW